MGKFLAINRNTSEAVYIDTTARMVVPIGAAIAGLSTTSAWPGRSQQLANMFQAEPHILMRLLVGTVNVLRYDGVSWLASALTFSPTTGALSPLGLHKIHDGSQVMLAAVVLEDAGASPLAQAGWLDDAGVATFDSSAVVPAGVGRAGHSLDWRGVIHFTTTQGLWYFQPGVGVGLGFNTTAPYPGDDGNLIAPETPLGCFARWRNRLYFMQPATPLPRLYELDPTFDGLTSPAAGPASPQWFNKSATGITDPGVITVADDGAANCLFVTDNNELCYFYSHGAGTFLARTNAADFPAFTDVSANILPADVLALTDIKINLLEDSRRRTNHVHEFVITDFAGSKSWLLSWDGVNPMQVEAVLDDTGLVFITLNDQRADRAIFQNGEPEMIPGPVTENFKGNYSINYTLIDDLSRLMAISPEFTTDGVTWKPMTEGTLASDGIEDLSSSPAGDVHTFNWNATADLRGEDLRDFRIIARISGV